jgi:hypothetical protein
MSFPSLYTVKRTGGGRERMGKEGKNGLDIQTPNENS